MVNKQIELSEELVKYANGMNTNKEVFKWLEDNVKSEYPQGQVEHIIDYLNQTKKDFKDISYNRVSKRAKEWVEKMNKKGSKFNEVEGKDVKVIKDFGDGFKFVKLVSENSYKREGFMMGSCIKTYYGKDDEIYSLRDKKNTPHATLSKNSQQIKGKGNGSIHPKYIRYNIEFLKELGMEVRENEMKNLGYYDISKFKKYLSKETIKNLFKGKFWFKDNKLTKKDGDEFACLDMWDMIPLVKNDIKNEVKINFNLGSFNDNAIKFLWNNLKSKKKEEYDAKIGSSGNYAQVGSSGNYAQVGSSGNYAQVGSSGNYAQVGSSGDDAKIGSSGDDAKIGSSGNYAKVGSSGNYAQVGSSGNYAQVGSSGDDAKIGSSGDDAKIGSSGNYAKVGSSGDDAKIGSSGNDAKIGSSGNYAQVGSSGNYAQVGSSGDDAKIGSSGNYAKVGSSGNYAQVGSSGNYAKIGSSGYNAVCSAIGINSKIKAKKGSWITLAEYDDNYKPLYVKSAKIDGVKLREDTYYKLKNKKFVEVK